MSIDAFDFTLRPPVRSAALLPPLKWAGGKRWQLPIIRALWTSHRHRRLVEPFCGGLAIALGLTPDRAVLNDRNRHLINFYRWLQQGLVIDRPLVNRADVYYAARERFNRLRSERQDDQEAATLFYYLNRTGYNGLCRFNRGGAFNVPFGRHVTIAYQYDFSAYRNVLRDWSFTCGDATLVPIDPDDFIYADPPYDAAFTQYTPNGFHWDEHERVAHALARHRGPVVLANHATARVERLYRRLGFSLRVIVAPRRIRGARVRVPVHEVLATRNI